MKKIFVILFMLIPFVISCVVFIKPDNRISDNENRELKTLNTISPSNFQNDIEAYMSDQFIFRESIVCVKSEALYLTGKRDINGCYICKDRLIQKVSDSDIDLISCEKYADKINQLAKDTETYVMYVPSAVITQSKSLPPYAHGYDYDKLYDSLALRLSNAKLINIKNSLTDSEAYYLTDHHWSAYGSYSAYLEFCRMTELTPRQFDFEVVTEDFKGTLYSKALLRSSVSDSIKATEVSENISVTADGHSIDFYDKSALESKDKYNYFEGGNHGILTVENKNVKNGKILLILKDSFANSFLPYIIEDYEKIIMLDERYTFVSPNEIIEENKVNQILVLREIIS